MTYGLKRVEILSAQANCVTLLVLAAFIIYEAIHRLVSPPNVRGGLILVIALVGIGVNVAATWTLAQANRQSLNIEGTFQHILTDLYVFIGTAVAALVILITGFDRADPLASLLVAALMLRSAYGLLRDSAAYSSRPTRRISTRTRSAERWSRCRASARCTTFHVWEVTSGGGRPRYARGLSRKSCR
jgi:cobalt-zinc-cadmium efflux system protein